MPSRKRSRAGTVVSVRSSGSGRRPSFNKRVSKRRYKIRRGVVTANYSFSRYLVNQPAANIAVTGGSYNTTTSVLTCGSNVTEIDVGQNFTIGSVPNVSEFSTLFDQYKIRRVVITMKLLNVPENSAAPMLNYANYGNFYPTIWWVNDYDDSGPVTLAAIKEFHGVKHRVLFPNRELKMSVAPTVLTQMFRTTLTTGYAPKKATWLDIAATDIPHYANKFVVDLEGMNTAVLDPLQLPRIKINYQVFFQCKGVR